MNPLSTYHLIYPAYGGSAEGMTYLLSGVSGTVPHFAKEVIWLVQRMTNRVLRMIGRVQPMTGRVQPMTGRVQPMTGRVVPMTGRVVPMTGRVVPMTGYL